LVGFLGLDCFKVFRDFDGLESLAGFFEIVFLAGLVDFVDFTGFADFGGFLDFDGLLVGCDSLIGLIGNVFLTDLVFFVDVGGDFSPRPELGTKAPPIRNDECLIGLVDLTGLESLTGFRGFLGLVDLTVACGGLMGLRDRTGFCGWDDLDAFAGLADLIGF
jgi:hypothetical protein